jgi:hypothetical protein
MLGRAAGWRYLFGDHQPSAIRPGSYAFHLNSTETGHVYEGYRFVANTTPRVTDEDVADANKRGKEIHEGDVMDFETMARQAEGIRRVGVLRMDVDKKRVSPMTIRLEPVRALEPVSVRLHCAQPL